MSTQHESPGRDQGSALIMAIVFVTVIGVAMAAGLGYAAATIRAQSTSYAPARDKLYASDAAIKAAINYVRNNPSEGNSATNPDCAPERDYGTIRDEIVTIQVCPQGGLSLTPKGGGSAWGLQTLAVGGEEGLVVDGKVGVQVNGNVLANSAIDVASNSSLSIAGGQVKALGGCNRNVYVDGTLLANCTVATPPATDPGYTLTGFDPSKLGGGSCNESTGIATLTAGTWTQATLDAAIDDCDYVNLAAGYHALENVDWTITGRVVAGTLAGDITTLPVGQACTQGSGGATIILGGTSTITLQTATPSLEVCGQAVTQAGGAAVELPLYGPTADLVGTAATSDTFTSTTSPTTTGSGTNWSNVSRAQTVNNSSATLSLSAGAKSRNLDIRGFNGTKAIPSSTTPITVDVYGSSSRSATFAVSVVNSSGTTLCAPVTGTFPSSRARVTVDLACVGLPTTTPANLTVRVVATAGSSPSQTRSIQVDGVVPRYSVAGTKVSAQSGCVTAVNGCAVLSSTGSGNEIFLDGEVYLPKAMIDVVLPNSSTSLTTLGITVRVLKVKANSTLTVPIVASENGALEAGDVTIVAKVGSDTWMTCRATFAVSGPAVTGSAIQGCTVPR